MPEGQGWHWQSSRGQAMPSGLSCLVAAPALPSTVRQRLVEPQHGHGSQRLVESLQPVPGQPEVAPVAPLRAGRVSLRRMHSLSSGQSFSSDLPGSSPSPASTSSTSCSSSTTTAPAPACHLHPIYYHHTTSYFLQMDSIPDLPPPDVTSGVRCRTGSFGYIAVSFLAASCLLCLRADACSGALSPTFLLPFSFGPLFHDLSSFVPLLLSRAAGASKEDSMGHPHAQELSGGIPELLCCCSAAAEPVRIPCTWGCEEITEPSTKPGLIGSLALLGVLTSELLREHDGWGP